MLLGCEPPTRYGGSGGPGSRSFYMGFTPWPYRADLSEPEDYTEVFYTYDLIQDYGDIVAHHFQQGIPYPEAYAMRSNPELSAISSNYGGSESGATHSAVGEVNLRAGQTDAVSRLYIAIDTTNSGREDLIGYYGLDYDGSGSTEQQARPDNGGTTPDIGGFANTIDWSSRTFADQEVTDAFVSYARAVIDEFESRGFDVAYFNYASEISDLLLVDAAEYADFLTFAERVYTALKAEYPSLPLMASVALKHPDSTKAQTIRSGIGNLTDYVDVLGNSVYPYAFFNPVTDDPASLPADWASQITDLSGGKPVAFTETGWIAQDLSVPAYSLSRSSNEAEQNAFLDRLFEEANALDAEFLIWFSLVDYSHYWANALGSDNVSAIWRDTGILDYDGSTDLNLGFDFDAIEATPMASAGIYERDAAATWRSWLDAAHR